MSSIPAPADTNQELAGDALALHAWALDASGWTLLRSQLGLDRLDALRRAANRALDATAAAIAEGRAGGHTTVDDAYVIARRFHRWGDAPCALLEHQGVCALAKRMFGSYHLFDCVVNATYPRRAGVGDDGSTGWHRDFGEDVHFGTAMPAHLFFLFCLDDLDEANGGLWVVPGSHRRTRQPEPAPARRPPSAMRVDARAGDLVVLDPAILHCSGVNRSAQPRRLASVGLCHARVAPACHHLAALDADERARLSPSMRTLLDFRWDEDHPAWAVGPDGVARKA